MTKRDELRVGKALQGANFPASQDQLLDYAIERGADSKTLTALRAVPSGSYSSINEVEQAVPQEPEGDQPGGTAR